MLSRVLERIAGNGLASIRETSSRIARRVAGAIAPPALTLPRDRDAERIARMTESLAHVGHWRLDQEGGNLFWSSEVFRIHGESPGAFTPDLRRSLAYYHADDRPTVAREATCGFQNGYVDFAARIIRPGGEVRHVVVRGYCQPDSARSDRSCMIGVIMDVTELRQAERDAAAQSALLAATLAGMDQGLIVVSPESRIEVCNPRAMELLGLPPGLMATRPSTEAVLAYQWASGEFETTDEKTLALLNHVMEEGGTKTYLRTRPNGTALEVRTKLLPGGGLVRTYTDVTERRRAEDALMDSEARYRLLAETTNDVITRLSLSFCREYISPSCQRVFGYEPSELVGKRPSESMHPDDISAVREVARKLVAGETDERRVTVTYRTPHKLGHWVWVEAAMTLARDGSGEPKSIICSLRDVSARKSAQAALARSEALYRLLADNASDLIVLGHEDGRRSYISPAVRTLLGYEVEEAHAVPMRDWVHPDDLGHVFSVTRGLSQASPTASVLYRLKRKDGIYIWAEAAFRRVDEGEGVTIITAIRDVTERQRQAEDLRSAITVAERSRGEAERARAAAEAASQAKTDFLASMSHEVRTPLNSILGYTDLLLDGGDIGGHGRRQLEHVRAAGSALLTVVNDILDFSKIEAGEVELDLRPFDLRSVLDGALSIVRTHAASKALTIASELDPNVPESLVGDPDRLRQILLNLLNNAVKFTPAGSVRLSVERVPANSGTCRLRIAVTDTGLGIAKEHQSRLFRRFSQVDGTIARTFGGTGLGLAITKNLVGMMGGEIGLESEQGRGSRFWFEVGLGHAPAGREEEPSPAPTSPVRNGARILLVEDLDINRDLATAVLERFGYAVEAVADGADAIAAVQSKPFDLVLMDLQMPGMDGLTATRHIRALSGAAAAVPIVAMTANVLPEQRGKMADAGMNGHVGKPFTREDLRREIERCLPETGSGRAVGSAVDDDAYRQMRDAVGPDRMRTLLHAFSQQLRGFLVVSDATAPDTEGLASEAHRMISAAGMLGFSELSRLCVGLELACRERRPEVGPLIAAVRDARARALAEAELLKVA